MCNKLTNHKENPIDNVLLRLTEKCLPFFHQTHHTPNILTTYSFACALYSVYALSQGWILQFQIFHVAGYFFDCADGQYARKYSMTSKFGDLYDHATDIVCNVLLVVILLKRYGAILRKYSQLVLILLIFFILEIVHIGCQQKHFNDNKEKKEFLDNFKILCVKKEWITWTRFFGSGTFYASILLLVLVLEYIKINDHSQNQGVGSTGGTE